MDNWQIVLLALYAEAIHGGSFAEVTAAALDMGKSDFGWTLYQLQMRGMIEGCRFQPPAPDSPGSVMGVIRGGLLLTPRGFETAEAMTEEQSDKGRLMKLWRLLRDVGCGAMANLIYSWLE